MPFLGLFSVCMCVSGCVLIQAFAWYFVFYYVLKLKVQYFGHLM